MSHRCEQCSRAFRKNAALRQHVQDVHVERPRQRLDATSRRALQQSGDAGRLVFRSERQMMVARGMVDAPPEFLPFGGFGIGGLLDTMREMLATIDASAGQPLALEPPTIEHEPISAATQKD